jgi:hypothetical protein
MERQQLADTQNEWIRSYFIFIFPLPKELFLTLRKGEEGNFL